MVNLQLKNGPVAFAVALGLLFAWEGYKGHTTLVAKAAEQDKVTESVQRWKSSYEALADVRQRWDKYYQPTSAIRDIVSSNQSLYAKVGLERYGLRTDQDNLVLNTDNPVTQNGTPIGLIKACMGTGTAEGGALIVEADNYAQLFDGINKLSRRPDIYIGNITVEGDKPQPLAKLGDFCMYLRKD